MVYNIILAYGIESLFFVPYMQVVRNRYDPSYYLFRQQVKVCRQLLAAFHLQVGFRRQTINPLAIAAGGFYF